WIAADLLSQAEHDPKSRVYAISPDSKLLDEVEDSVESRLSDHPNPDPVAEALEESELIVADDLLHAVNLSNDL
ncbi:MAG: histidinol dehydrogenase, partial [bacterium]